MSRINSRDESRSFSSLRKNDRIGKRHIYDDNELLFPSLSFTFSSLRLDDPDHDLFSLLIFNLLGNWNLRDEPFSFILPGCMEPSRLFVFSDFSATSKKDLFCLAVLLPYKRSHLHRKSASADICLWLRPHVSWWIRPLAVRKMLWAQSSVRQRS